MPNLALAWPPGPLFDARLGLRGVFPGDLTGGKALVGDRIFTSGWNTPGLVSLPES